MNKYEHIILFDGVCNYCNRWVNFIIRNDKKKKFLFAPLQSPKGKEILASFNIKFPEDEKENDSVVLVHAQKYFLRSDAPMQIAKILGGKWLAVYYLLKIIPRFIRDGGYDFIARNRYKWFGKKDVCMIPDESVRGRFLE